MEFGMSDKLGPLTFGRKEGQVFLGRDLARERDFSEEVAAAIDSEERKIIGECYDHARSVLDEKKAVLTLVAETLLERETLKGEELNMLLEGKQLPALQVAAGGTAGEQAKESSQGAEDKSRKDVVPDKGRVAPVPESSS